ncbi:MAG TPA: hypothetical protein VMU43_05645 [Candidatus Acidoferrum sp.]|nr:hypothetical protein [Candidatus Acidoferrum sp.]
MTRARRLIWTACALALLGVFAAAAVAIYHRHKHPVSMWGAILKDDSDPRKQSPISDVQVAVAGMTPPVTAKTDFSGLFKLQLPPGIRRGMKVELQLRHPGYQPLDLEELVSDDLDIIRMKAVPMPAPVAPSGRPNAVANVLIRYSIETTTSMNIGSAISTFEVENKGNVPCRRHRPCSPDGKWKATIGSGTLDAGSGNVLDDIRVSCIAGPCPFTRVLSDDASHHVRKIAVSVLNWSDTTTFLLQAEVYREEINDIVRESYPVIFGQFINFTLPSEAEGPTLEAEINGTQIIFPLGPTPILSWANCEVRTEQDKSKSYRCELKPGYVFQHH